ncbi:flagellar basal body rod protein FlgC [Candidatus Magnetobacterium casense]|uniref:flagellar basal body rod protein FlgC n=1 Tax=Candidatus Magnetobacterium casense TaxID=1455061 RepID=UPI0005909232|nr:flagellar basal body rod protein FlgC [Candidatus Magnetobacterium casensis]
MDTFGVFNVSASALVAQRQRMNSIASNVANIHTTRTQEGGPYKRQDVVFEVLPIGKVEEQAMGVQVSKVLQDENPPMKVYNPSHPDADEDGYISLPNVNVVEEMVNMMTAARAYEANVSAFNISKGMFLKTLEIGRY